MKQKESKEFNLQERMFNLLIYYYNVLFYSIFILVILTHDCFEKNYISNESNFIKILMMYMMYMIITITALSIIDIAIERSKLKSISKKKFIMCNT